MPPPLWRVRHCTALRSLAPNPAQSRRRFSTATATSRTAKRTWTRLARTRRRRALQRQQRRRSTGAVGRSVVPPAHRSAAAPRLWAARCRPRTGATATPRHSCCAAPLTSRTSKKCVKATDTLRCALTCAHALPRATQRPSAPAVLTLAAVELLEPAAPTEHLAAHPATWLRRGRSALGAAQPGAPPPFTLLINFMNPGASLAAQRDCAHQRLAPARLGALFSAPWAPA